MGKKVKIDKHLNLYKNDIEAFERMYGTEHGIFSRVTREIFHNFIEKQKYERRKREEKEDTIL